MRALRDELITQKEFADRIGSTQSWLSRLSSEGVQYKCGKKFARRVLSGFNGKYVFSDLFFWVD